MSRYEITSLYENTILSRPYTRELLNEINNSPANIERFKSAYCPWIPFGHTKDRDWMWLWPRMPGYSPDPDRIPAYNKLFISKKFPDPLRVKVKGDKISSEFVGVFAYSLPVQSLRQGETWKEQFHVLLADLLEKAADKKFGAEFLHRAIEEKIEKNDVWRIEVIRDGNEWDMYKEKFKVRYVLDDLVIHFMIIYFMNIQKILPQRDIFRYGSALDLLQAMNSAVSNREKKSTKGAAVQNTIPGFIYEDDNVLVIEPQDWAFSRRYFGAPQRRSLLTKGKIIEGATWCTAASNNEHWQKYILGQKNHLYYFIEKPTDTLFAIRTAGGGNDSDDLIIQRLDRSVFSDVHRDMMFYLRTNNKLSDLENVTKFENKVREIHRGARDERHFMRAVNKIELEKLISAAVPFKALNYTAYTEFFTMEARDQENKIIPVYSIFNKFNLNEEWIRKHIKFFDVLDQ
jgi:hypothetical protein